MIGMLLFERGAGVSYRSSDSRDVSFKARIDTLAQKARVSERSAERAILQMRDDGLLSSERTKNKFGRYAANSFTLLDPETRKPLQTFPGKYGLLSSNHWHDFITIPRDCIPEIVAMPHASERAVYLSGHSIASSAVSEMAYIEKAEWLKRSHVGRNAFAHGLKYCAHKRLFSYARNILVVHDPRTGRPTQRWRNDRSRFAYANKQHDVDLDKVTPDEWCSVLHKLIGLTIYDGAVWRRCDEETACPLCGRRDCFTVSVSLQGFRCHRCGAHGKLGQLVQRVLNVSWADALAYVEEVKKANVEVEV